MKLILGDCAERMRELPMESVDCVITDPPYGLEFMGTAWDSFGDMRQPFRSEIVPGPGPYGRLTTRPSGTSSYTKSPRVAMNAYQDWCTAWGTEALRSLKPGGYLLAFGGTRTHHRLISGLEEAGFEIRDCLMWLYGQGFPKGRNLPGGLGTGLKPAWEPILLARKELDGRFLEPNVTRYGTGALNIEDARVGESKSVPASPSKTDSEIHYGSFGTGEGRLGTGFDPNIGRWPANLLLSHGEGCVQIGTRVVDGRKMNRYVDGPKPFGGVSRRFEECEQTNMPDEEVEVWDCVPGCPLGGFVGARFFYVPKVTMIEREAGLEAFTDQDYGWSEGARGALAKGESYDNGDGGINRTTRRKNIHPTVKPIDLVRYLVRLACPKGGTVLDPFMGSGTTGIAAQMEGRGFIGVEKDPGYMKIAKARIRYWDEHGADGWRVAAEREAAVARRERAEELGQMSLL